MTPPLSSPRDRSNFARKAAQVRWAHANLIYEERSVDSNQPQAISPLAASQTAPGEPPTANNELRTANREPRTAKRKSRTTKRVDWLTTRFCLSLHQDSAGAWFLLTPSGLSLPASPAEISFWLDIQELKRQYRVS